MQLPCGFPLYNLSVLGEILPERGAQNDFKIKAPARNKGSREIVTPDPNAL